MIILLEAGFLKKDSRFREKGGQTSNLYTLEYPSQNNKTQCKKEFKEEVVKSEKKQKLDNCEEIETVSFFDYKTHDDSISETIDDELLKGNNEEINDIPGLNYKGDISAIPIECHGAGDNLYPP